MASSKPHEHDPLCFSSACDSCECDLITRVRSDVSMAINRRMLARAVVANDHHDLVERDIWLLASDIARNWVISNG